MNIMLIGSKAAQHHFPDFPRTPKDTDYISKDEIDRADAKYCPSFELILQKYPGVEVAPPTILYTMKVSHSFWDIFWEKTMYDILFFQSKGFSGVDESIFQALYQDHEQRYGKKKGCLNKDNERFFEDGVQRVYVHDSLHEAVAFYEAPLYTKIKSDQSKALTSKALFDKLSFENKVKLCLEEIYVTALERFMIPNDFRIHHKSAFFKAVKLLVTSMSRGWFPKWIVEHYTEIRNASTDYTIPFKQALKNNRIKYV